MGNVSFLFGGADGYLFGGADEGTHLETQRIVIYVHFMYNVFNGPS